MFWLIPIVSFLVGSIPFGLIIAKAKGVDIRQHGSGNIGATNVGRVVGKAYGILVFALDFLKGLLPVIIARPIVADEANAPILLVATALAAILGHNYPPWLGFRGGKGISTSAGALIALFPIALLIGLLVWILLFKCTRYVSVASMAGAVVIPAALAVEMSTRDNWQWAYLAFGILIALLAIWRHRSNIINLIHGREHRIPPKPSS